MPCGKISVVHFRFSSVAKNHKEIYMELRECDLNRTKAGRQKCSIQAINGCRLRRSEGAEAARMQALNHEHKGKTFVDHLQDRQKALKTKGKHGAEDWDCF